MYLCMIIIMVVLLLLVVCCTIGIWVIVWKVVRGGGGSTTTIDIERKGMPPLAEGGGDRKDLGELIDMLREDKANAEREERDNQLAK